MLAIGEYVSFHVEKADDVIKSVIPEADYMYMEMGYTLAFVKNDKGEFIVNGIKYTTVGTNDYKKLKNMKCKNKQMSIFDY